MFKIKEKWKDNEFVKMQTRNSDKDALSVLLDNASNNSLPPNKGIESFYEENKVSMTARIWSYLKSNRLVGYQPLTSESDKIYYIRNKIKENGENYFSNKTSILESTKCKIEKVPLKTQLSLKELKGLQKFYNTDASQEYKSLLISEIAFELDAIIVNKIYNNCGTIVDWDFTTALGYTIKEIYESLYVRLLEVSNTVNRKCLAGGTNFIFTSPEIASLFECACNVFSANENETDWTKHSFGIQYVGTINNRWRLYKNPLFTPNQIITGYSGESSMDQGLIFSPRNLFEIARENKDNPGRWDLASDYGLTFTPNGQNYFARINIKNFIC